MFKLWFLAIGLLLICMALVGSMVKRIPLTTSALYLLAGIGLGPWGLALIRIEPLEHAVVLERLTEVAVIVSLFTTGLKLSIPLDRSAWKRPVLLAFVSMTITVGLIALVSRWLFGLSPGAAILLGAILAPTDPVLASAVQVQTPTDVDRLRFSLTGEAGLNDGTAFPFVMLGLGLMQTQDRSALLVHWIGVDVLWSITGGLLIGWILGGLVGRLIIYLRSVHHEAVGTDDYLALGLIALSYGLALILHTYGFLAVFAAGLALRRVENRSPEIQPDREVKEAAEALEGDAMEAEATDPVKASAYMTKAVLSFNEQLERILEISVVVLLGAMLSFNYFTPRVLTFIALLFLLIRPVSVFAVFRGGLMQRSVRGYAAWFGIRGIGSIYYLMYAVQHPPIGAEMGRDLIGVTLSVVAVSIVIHGVSVTPLMHRYAARKKASP